METPINSFNAPRRFGSRQAAQFAIPFATWPERSHLAVLVFEAVRDALWLAPETAAAAAHAGLDPEKMMLLVTYCYAIGIYDSGEIAACVACDEVLRELFESGRPTAETVRQFRWANSEAIIRALRQVLCRAGEWQASASN